MSEALYERAPYKGVLTHGFTVDEKGRKMSKSLGNVVAPEKVMNDAGRRHAAAVGGGHRLHQRDERARTRSSSACRDSYRRMRNTVRFLLGNLHGFDPAVHAVPMDKLLDSRCLGDRARAQRCSRRSSRPTATTSST